MTDATRALEQMDAAGLEGIAGTLQTLLAGETRVAATAEIAARHRVFASVLRATGDNLKMLHRLAAVASEETQWAR